MLILWLIWHGFSPSPGPGPGPNPSICKHWVYLPYYSLVMMEEWLDTIGERNRYKLRHIDLCISSSRFTTSRDETPEHEEYGPDIGGDEVCDALQILSEGHNLQTLDILVNALPLTMLDGDESLETFEIHGSTFVVSMELFDIVGCLSLSEKETKEELLHDQGHQAVEA